MDPFDAKVQVAALTKTPEVAATFKATVEQAAANQIKAWRQTYENQIATKGRQTQRDFEAVWTTNSGTRIEDVVVPPVYSAATEKVVKDAQGKATTAPIPARDKHIYVAPSGHRVAPEGKFPAALTGWEEDVLNRETDISTLVGWYRNPARSQHGLGVAFKDGNQTGVMYPDFIFFHEDHGIALDIVDPHRHNEADTGPKWAGPARWASKNHDKVRRAVAVIKVGDDLKALDLTKDGIADRLDECHGKPDIEALFADLGSAY